MITALCSQELSLFLDNITSVMRRAVCLDPLWIPHTTSGINADRMKSRCGVSDS